MNGEGDWNANNKKNLRIFMRWTVERFLEKVGAKAAGGVPIEDFGAAAAALLPIQAVLEREFPRTPENDAERKAI